MPDPDHFKWLLEDNEIEVERFEAHESWEELSQSAKEFITRHDNNDISTSRTFISRSFTEAAGLSSDDRLNIMEGLIRDHGSDPEFQQAMDGLINGDIHTPAERTVLNDSDGLTMVQIGDITITRIDRGNLGTGYEVSNEASRQATLANAPAATAEPPTTLQEYVDQNGIQNRGELAQHLRNPSQHPGLENITPNLPDFGEFNNDGSHRVTFPDGSSSSVTQGAGGQGFAIDDQPLTRVVGGVTGMTISGGPS